jgi:hypothetical protein
MGQLNCNTPYIKCYIRKEFTGQDKEIEGYIFGCKAMLNYPMLFHFQSQFGAIFWNMSISAFVHKLDYDILNQDEQKRLSLLESWDCQSSNIATTCFKFLEYKRVDVFCRDKKWREGTYLFTIDDYEEEPNAINVGYSNNMDSKCFHFIELIDGNYCIQPNNLLRWHNPDFIIPYDKDNPPRIKIDSGYRSSERIDRSYGNSPYYFYGNEYENDT